MKEKPQTHRFMCLVGPQHTAVSGEVVEPSGHGAKAGRNVTAKAGIKTYSLAFLLAKLCFLTST